MRRILGSSNKSVELLNVPYYTQGSFDGLCAYYSGLMMMATLIPELTTKFGKTGERATKYMFRDPLIAEQTAISDDHRQILASWFINGEYISELVRKLNKITKSHHLNSYIAFKHQVKNCTISTYNFIKSQIDDGLPVILGFDTEDYGSHAVLVKGYWIGKEKWLISNDPGGYGEYNWKSLSNQTRTRTKSGKSRIGTIDLAFCTKHIGPRPMKSIIQGEIQTVYQWVPGQTYVNVRDLFTEVTD